MSEEEELETCGGLGALCLCGHAREEHHDLVAECEHHGSSGESGADEHGWPHCALFVWEGDDERRRVVWEAVELAAFYRTAYERLRRSAEQVLEVTPCVDGPLKDALAEIDDADERRRRSSQDRAAGRQRFRARP